MKKIFISLLLMLVAVVCANAQTKRSRELWEMSKTVSREVFLQQDFTAVDSTSMHDLAVLLYRDKDLRLAGDCWEIALSKVKKYGKAYEQILNALSSVYIELDDQDKIAWLMPIVEDYNLHELSKECTDYKGKLERAQYYINRGDEQAAKQNVLEAIELCSSEEQIIEVEECYARMLFGVTDLGTSAQYFYSAYKRWKSLGGSESRMWNDLSMAVQGYLISDNFDSAEYVAREAMCLFETEPSDSYRPYYLQCITCLGAALTLKGRCQEALDVYKQEVAGYASFAPYSEKYADALEHQAGAETRLKLFDDAKKHYNEALSIYKSLGLSIKYSNTFSLLIVCLRKSGDSATASEMEKTAKMQRQEVWQNILDSELPSLDVTRKYLGLQTYVNSLSTVTGCYLGLEQYEKASEYLSDYTDCLREMLMNKFAYMTEKGRERIWEEQWRNIDELYFSIATLPSTAEDMLPLYAPSLYNLELLSKGELLNSSIEFERVLQQSQRKELLDVYDDMKLKQAQIERLQSVVSDENLDKILHLKQEIIPLEQSLMDGCREYRDCTEYLSYTWKDVQRHLAPGDVAIEFTSLRPSVLDSETFLLALVLQSEGVPQMKCVSTKALLTKMSNADDLYDNPKYFKYIWGHLSEFLDGKNRVFFASCNLLNSIAVEYLRDGDASFFETHEVYRLSSTKELCRDYDLSNSKTLTVFGGIDYNTDIVSEEKGGISFGQLPFSKEEIKGIRHKTSRKFKLTVYDGRNATVEHFMAMSGVSCPAILHISSHGKYSGNANTKDEDAMALSILALSGANVGSSGVLTAADISRMNLRGCDLAVLSACESGLGALGTDGVFGLQRGFKNAGVHSLLMSVKSVYDESTAKLMVYFYEGLASGLSKRDALLEAQKKLRSNPKYNAGKYWAPFILLDGYEHE